MADKELSDLSLSRKECPKCGAVWINGNNIWRGTANEGSEVNLAGLVWCKYGDETCINPMKGVEGGVTWEDRLKTLETLDKEK